MRCGICFIIVISLLQSIWCEQVRGNTNENPRGKRVLGKLINDLETSANGYVYSRLTGSSGIGGYGTRFNGLGSGGFRSYAAPGNYETSGLGSNYPNRYGVGNIRRGNFGPRQGTVLNSYGIPNQYEIEEINEEGVGYNGNVETPTIHETTSSIYGISNTLPKRDSRISNFHPGIRIESQGASGESNYETADANEQADGYRIKENFDKNEKETSNGAKNSGHYDGSSASKIAHDDESKKYLDNKATEKGEAGENYVNSQGHKKGHKTSGFHNVYHKDEYKKDTSFYDDDHVDKHKEEYGADNSEHSLVEGAREKTEKIDSAHKEHVETKEGAFTNGHQYGGVQGHGTENAEKGHYEKESGYSKQANSLSGI